MIRHLALHTSAAFLLTGLGAAQEHPRDVAPTIRPAVRTTPGSRARVRVGTWNLEHLGQRKPARKPGDYQAIAAFIREIGFDVLAVQEIAGAAPLRTLCAELGPDWRFVLGSSGEFRDHSGRINVGFLWNERTVAMLQAEELLNLPREVDGIPILHRVPVTAAFRAKLPGGGHGIDFRLVAVHLKASQGAKNEHKRKLEVRALRRWLAGILASPTEDRDVLVLGDFNHGYEQPACTEFCADGFATYLRPTAAGMTIVHFDTPIDHIARIRDGIADELIDQSMRVHRALALEDKDRWRSIYSDHVPVSIDLNAATDRDPEAHFAGFAPGQRLRPNGFAEARAVATPAATASSTNGQRPRSTPASARAPGRRNATDVEASAAPIAIGARITVFLQGGMRVHGTLAAPLGSWVYLRVPDGAVEAYPERRVVSVRRR